MERKEASKRDTKGKASVGADRQDMGSKRERRQGGRHGAWVTHQETSGTLKGRMKVWRQVTVEQSPGLTFQPSPAHSLPNSHMVSALI